MERRKDLLCIDHDGNVIDDAYAFTVDDEKLFSVSNLQKTIFMLTSVTPEMIEDARAVYNKNKMEVKKAREDYNLLQNAVKLKEENQHYSRYFKKDIDLPLHDIARIFYLSTYLARGSNYIITRRNNIAKKNDIMHLLNLNKKTFLRFWDEATKSGILIEDETGVMLDPKMFTRQNGIGKGTPMLRCFESIRELYEEAKVSQHKILGYIFKLLPYLNGYHNIICENPEEHNEEKIIPLSTEEICRIAGYEYSNRSKLMKTLNSISIYRDGIEQFVFLNTYAKEHKNNITIVNPLFFFGGEWAKKDMISALFCKRLYENIKKKSINKNISYDSKDIS